MLEVAPGLGLPVKELRISQCGIYVLWLKADFRIFRLRRTLQKTNMAATVVGMAVQLCQVILALGWNCEDGGEDLQESVCDSLAKIDELLELGVLAVDDIVVDSTRVSAGTLNVSTADPVLLVVVRSSVFVYDRGS